jgi:hypothetical protein
MLLVVQPADDEHVPFQGKKTEAVNGAQKKDVNVSFITLFSVR